MNTFNSDRTSSEQDLKKKKAIEETPTSSSEEIVVSSQEAVVEDVPLKEAADMGKFPQPLEPNQQPNQVLPQTLTSHISKYIDGCKNFFNFAEQQSQSIQAVQQVTQPSEDDFNFRSLEKKEIATKVFILNSPNDTLKKKVMDCLDEWNVQYLFFDAPLDNPISLEEKFAQHSDVQFSMFLLSGDEFVYAKAGKPQESKLRIRHEIAFLLGYHLAKFGRNNVFILYQEQKSFLLPTGFINAIFTSYDKAGLWRQDLQKRLCTYGLELGKN